MAKGNYEERLKSVTKIIDKESTIKGEAKSIGVDKNLMKFWLKLYIYHGEEALKDEKRKYSKEEREEAVKYYKENNVSIIDCAARFRLTNPSTLRMWLRKEENN